ncbi:3-isopropylmalate dehydratase large subunit [Brucella gallinifaecis]|uniref:3-isopropylmalate dehydratase n=1 Tax=Brucella gallinifaecis TaxID=215590 RepID=A0A502BIE0_9HYPH|nr:3-isopropylmalate dehydratase large subunit [Brucella gallinifaecis]TPF73934.1 3-isopropylmalate dehydratase large subunit [Brucella gallinifaecis]
MQTFKTLFDNIWDRHSVIERDGQTLLYIDRHYIGDDMPRGTLEELEKRGLKVRRPDLTFASPDHYAPTNTRDIASLADAEQREMVTALEDVASKMQFSIFNLDDPRQGIVHVFGPELGLSLPGMTIACGDSHTATHGAFGAFGLGIGSTEVTHVLATQSVWQRKPRNMRITIDGELAPLVTAKDVILYIISRIGVSGARGHVVEYTGSAVKALSMEGRMTLCNMSIEAGAKAGLIAPDEITLNYLRGRACAPSSDWDKRAATWLALKSDPNAIFDKAIILDAAEISPMVSWGNTPGETIAIDRNIPHIASFPKEERERIQHALDYMALSEGQPISGTAVDKVFIGSCTNGRIEDLRAVSSILRNRRVAVPTIIVPGSTMVRKQAEKEGLNDIFLQAGAEWRYAGCSMCLAINGDMASAGERVASTTNRNFVGRQGKGSRTHIMSPSMAAAAAVTGCLTDVRSL